MNKEVERNDVAVQLRNVGRVLREQKWLILACVVATAVGAGVYGEVQEPEYKTSAKVLVQQENISAAISQVLPPSSDPNRQAATDKQLATLPEVSARAGAKLRVRQPKRVIAAAEGDSNVVSITVEDGDPELTAAFANAYAEEYIKFRRDAAKRRYDQTLRIVNTRIDALTRRQRRSPQGVLLREQARQLKLASQLQTGDAQVIQRASVPGSPFKPRKTRAIVLGVVFGLLLGFALALLRDRLDRRIKTEEQVRELLPNVPVIGSIPALSRGKKGHLAVAEGFHNLQASLRLLGSNARLRSLLVTSAAPGEGKSTVTANLALAMREHGRSPLILEADLRHPALSDRLQLEPNGGVSTILAGDGTFASSLRRTPVEPSRNGKGPAVSMPGELQLIPAGPIPPNPQVLLDERRMESLLTEARAHSDNVIVDGPPMGMFSDMLPVAKRVDGVIVTVRLYHSRRDDVRRFAERLADAGVEPLGVVVVGTGQDLGYYGYGY
jgi:capsular exopolysaccharide synthesis family protein